MNTPQRDKLLIFVVAALVILGLIMVQSASGPVATEQAGDAFFYVKRQSAGALVGLAGCLAFAWMPQATLRRNVWLIYGVAIFGLLAVFVPGIQHKANGAARWIGVGGVHFQPSEFAKIALALTLANFLDRHVGRLHDIKRVLLPALAIPAPVLVLVVLEPDFGTTVLLGMLTLLVLYTAGLSNRWMTAVFAAGLAVGVPVMLVASYRIARLMSFLNPWEDYAGAGYQVIQSQIAFQNGGLLGRGLAESQAKHHFLPESWTDFIASVLAEELGLLGLLALITLYGLVVWRGLVIARRADSLFGTLLANSLTALLGLQAFFNMGVAMGVLPPKGLVLPFMSYGPSALMIHLFTIGLLLNVSAHAAPEIDRGFRLAASWSKPSRDGLAGGTAK